MALREVTPPTGGRVWIRSRLTHGQARELDDARAALPARALGRLAAAIDADGRGTLDDGDVAAVTAGMRALRETTLRVCVARSEDVRDPDGSAISLPDDLDRLDEIDFDFLVDAADAALAEGFGDPNGSRGSSVTPSSPDGSAGTSPPTSGTPS